jgi:site-specific DNA-methyltransferase (adenine-specific)
MKPYFQEDGCTIYHADCREVLPMLPRGDLCLTDPPYGVGVEYASFEDTPENVRRLVGEVIPLMINKCKRVLLTCATRQQHFYPVPTWILCWHCPSGAGMNPWGFTCWQPILAYGPDPYLEKNLGSRPDVITFVGSDSSDHPCPKPIGIWKKILERGSVSGDDLIIDPFMGSGTTLRAALDSGRRAIGIEIEEKYCEIAAKRLSQKVLPF